MDNIDLWNLSQGTPTHGQQYEDNGGHDSLTQSQPRYETDGDRQQGAYEDRSGTATPTPDGLGPSFVSIQPRGVNGMPLGPEPDIVNTATLQRTRAASRTIEGARTAAINDDSDEEYERTIVRGEPLPKWFRTAAEISAAVYFLLAIISIVERNVFDGLFFGSVTSTALAMELALRGASPPALPSDFCGGKGPNQLPASWFVVGTLWLAVTNAVAWSLPTTMHLKAYAIGFLLWAAFDLFLLIVMQEFKIFFVDAFVVFTLFIFNVMFQYEAYKQDEETFIAFCCLVVVVHLPLNVLQITYHDDCNEALRRRFLPHEAEAEDDDEALMDETSMGSPLGLGRRLHHSTSPSLPQPYL